MDVARDICGITLPFAAGVAAAVFFSGLSYDFPGLSVGLACSTILVCVILLLHPSHHSFSPVRLRLTIFICLVSCGMLRGLSAELLDIGRNSSGGFMERAGIAMGNAIDRIRFENTDTNAILKALITGDRTNIPGHITEAFRESGASHILALSGLHLGIIYGLLSKTLSFLGNTPAARRSRSIAIVLTCGFYTLAVGAGASIVRAFLFILLGETARITGRFRSTGTILMASLLIHLIFTPQTIGEVGFQLSYAAMAGIAFIFPWLKDFWPEPEGNYDTGKMSWVPAHRPRPLQWIWNTAALSISCQITTGPLAYLYFGTFPLHFLLTNLLAIPLTGLIIPVALFTLILNTLGICPEILIQTTELLTTCLSYALEVISTM